MLGFSILLNAGYSPQGALGMINVLDSAMHLKYTFDKKLFEPFYSTKYPFEEIWLKMRLSVYSKKPTEMLIFSVDSIETHPDIELRRKALLAKVQTRHWYFAVGRTCCFECHPCAMRARTGGLRSLQQAG